jgi:hypothetical protein
VYQILAQARSIAAKMHPGGYKLNPEQAPRENEEVTNGYSGTYSTT